MALSLVGGWHSIFLIERDAETEFAEAAAHRKLLKDMGTDVFIVAECTRTIHGDKSKPLVDAPDDDGMPSGRLFTTRLTQLAELLRQDEGFQPRLSSSYGNGGADAETKIDRAHGEYRPGPCICCSTPAMPPGAAPIRRCWRANTERASAHVHCKDVRPAVRARKRMTKDWSFLDSVIAGVYTVPGDGMVDYVSVFKELAGYSGWVVVEAEQDPKKAEPAKYAKMGHDNLVRFLKSRRTSVMSKLLVKPKGR